LVTDVGSPNVSKSITADELAQGSQFSSRFVPKSGDTILIPAASFGASYQSPTLGNVGGTFGGWLLDPSTDEYISSAVYVPDWWATYHVDILWTINAVSSGDVRFVCVRDSAASGQNIASATTSDSLTATAPAQYVTFASRIATASTLAIGAPMALTIYRDGADAADTLSVDCAVLAVMLVRAS
jgi:hypothetical protein